MFLKLVTVTSLLIISTNSQSTQFKDYYWRTYVDSIPNDAFEGGQNENTTTYIGQVHDHDLTPVEIRPGHREVYVPSEHPYARNHYITILCTETPEMFRWYSTTAEQVEDLLKTKTAMRGGIDTKNVPFYIGKVFFRNQQLIGRVRLHGRDSYMESLYWSAGGYYYHKSTEFDLLVYEDPIAAKKYAKLDKKH